jgi:hypothetical protein
MDFDGNLHAAVRYVGYPPRDRRAGHGGASLDAAAADAAQHRLQLLEAAADAAEHQLKLLDDDEAAGGSALLAQSASAPSLRPWSPEGFGVGGGAAPRARVQLRLPSYKRRASAAGLADGATPAQPTIYRTLHAATVEHQRDQSLQQQRQRLALRPSVASRGGGTADASAAAGGGAAAASDRRQFSLAGAAASETDPAALERVAASIASLDSALADGLTSLLTALPDLQQCVSTD